MMDEDYDGNDDGKVVVTMKSLKVMRMEAADVKIINMKKAQQM